ncbi:response regulator [Paenibacillus psychroresistens]|uniref:Response regulator n=1 Tax=Paenibacillus psychroresistens TaxID=1778678 RepID=A0A6B8RJ00_9BACL|nr:response regulator [Paenibacillus psychroresistens]QGQ95595.1 response regulator [Paenibacillus psychroresistens]
MIRILIVDDEILVRIGLKTIIPMGDDGFEIIGEAANGREALDILEAQPCEIVLTDIRMPGMDGLELLKQIRERWPAIKCLILSNHDDFTYVQQALRLGAIEYIIKLAIDPSELMLKLRSIKQQLLLEQQKISDVVQLEFKVNQYGREVKEKRLRELMLGQCSKREIEAVFKEFRIQAFHAPISIINVQIESYEDLIASNRFQSERLLHFTVQNVIAEILKKYGNGELVEMENGKFTIIKDELNIEMLQEMQSAVSTFLKLSIGFGVSPRFADVYELYQAYEKAEESLNYRFYLGRGCIVQYEQVPESDDTLSEAWQEDDWIKRIDEQNEPAMRQALSEWTLASLAEARVRPSVLREQWVRLLSIFARCLKAEGCDIYSVTLHKGKYPYHVIRRSETLQDLTDWFIGWIPLYLQYKRQHSKQKLRTEIQAVIQSILEHYNLPLKVSELAAKVGFTENYLSILFKKETGETITDYMIHVRMKKARDLLKNPDNKIYEISEQIGYTDPNHFSRTFKQIEGMYPTEFRKLYLGKAQ